MKEFVFRQEFTNAPSGLFVKMYARKPSQERRKMYKALVDTGLQITGISKRIVDEFSLEKVREVDMVDANGNTHKRPTFLVDLIIPGSPEEYSFISVEAPLSTATQGEDILLGMNILKRGSFSFENLGEKYVMTFKININ